MTPEKNQKYILDNLDKYVLDSRGNFVHIDSDLMGSENAELYFIGKESVSNRGEILDAFSSMILQNKGDWELVIDGSFWIKNKRDGRIMNQWGFNVVSEGEFNELRGYKIVGELGFRESIWENYEEVVKEREREKGAWEERKKLINNSNNQQSQTQNEPNKKPDQQQLFQNKSNSPTQNSEIEKKQNQNNPLSNQDQPTEPTTSNQTNNNPSPEEKETSNNPLPSPTEIQNNYNSDKDKSEIENNSNLTSPEQKDQANKLLKIVISAELLIKKKQFNSEILTKLITEKKNNTSLYQLLNKESRIDKVISKLESIQQQSQKHNNKSLVKNQDNDQIPTGIIVICGAFLLLGLGMVTMVVRKKTRKKVKH